MQFKSKGYKNAIVAYVKSDQIKAARVADICIAIMKEPDASILNNKSFMLKEKYIQGVMADTKSQGAEIKRSRIRQTWKVVVVPAVKYDAKENQFTWNYEQILKTAAGVKSGEIKVEPEYATAHGGHKQKMTFEQKRALAKAKIRKMMETYNIPASELK